MYQTKNYRRENTETVRLKNKMYVDGKKEVITTEKEVGSVMASNMKNVRVNGEDARDRVKYKLRTRMADSK